MISCLYNLLNSPRSGSKIAARSETFVRRTMRHVSETSNRDLAVTEITDYSSSSQDLTTKGNNYYSASL